MAAIVRVTDETTVDELLALIAHAPRDAWDATRETMIDGLWADVLRLRAG